MFAKIHLQSILCYLIFPILSTQYLTMSSVDRILIIICLFLSSQLSENNESTMSETQDTNRE